jgi:hypothetical protein
MSQTHYYKGLYKVKIVTESEGYVTVEALENFEDTDDGEKVNVKAGETRIVQPSDLSKKKTLPPPIPEHLYERQLEQQVKRLVEEFDRDNGS